MRLAVIGSGVSGLVCAHRLQQHHDVVLFEADARLGGHANTVDIEDPVAGPLAIDTGFIVHNDRNYPNLVRLFGELGVPTQDTEMSFAVTDRPTGFSYRATNLNTLFADRRNLTDPRMWRMLRDIVRFYHHGRRHLADAARAGVSSSAATPLADISISEFLGRNGYGREFIDLHLVPMGAAVWSADPASFDQFPATSLLRFLSNHGLLGVGRRPQWRTVVGGSRTYVEAIERHFTGEVRRSTPVQSIVRVDGRRQPHSGRDEHVIVEHTGEREHFDRVILACHSDQALRLLADATPREEELLGAIRYQPNRATLHTDVGLLSDHRRAWAAWNYERHGPEQEAATVTYDLTALQRLPGSRRYLVSLNSESHIDNDHVISSFNYAHPIFDQPAIEAQSRFDEIDGVSGVHFCGAYWGHGFHEDGVVSALRVCEKLAPRSQSSPSHSNPSQFTETPGPRA